MSIPLQVNGRIDITFYNVHTNEEIKDPKIEWGIHDNLTQGEYVLNYNDGCVYDINDETIPLYKFILKPYDLEIFN